MCRRSGKMQALPNEAVHWAGEEAEAAVDGPRANPHREALGAPARQALAVEDDGAARCRDGFIQRVAPWLSPQAG
jgi:hypothetical protein